MGPGPSWISRTSYLVLDLGEDGAGPVEEPLSEPHLVLVVLVAPLADRGVLPLLEPLVLHHGQDGHAGLPCGAQIDTLECLRGGDLSAGLSAVTVPTRVSDGGLGVFGRRHGDEHHGDVVGRLLFAQGEEVVHP